MVILDIPACQAIRIIIPKKAFNQLYTDKVSKVIGDLISLYHWLGRVGIKDI